MKVAVFVLAAILAFLINVPYANAQNRVRIWFDSFIDPKHPSIADFSRVTKAGTKVIRAPDAWAPPGFDIRALKGTCFSTDERSFESSPTSSARGRVDFTLEFEGRRRFILNNSTGRDGMIFIGETRNVDCESGKDLRPPAKADADGIKIGSIKENGFLKLFNVRASIGDPFYKILGLPVAPKLDFEFVVEYSVTGLSLKIYGFTGNFPSYEGYYQINDGKIEKFLTRSPINGATPYSLFDLGLGINTTNFNHTIDLSDYML